MLKPVRTASRLSYSSSFLIPMARTEMFLACVLILLGVLLQHPDSHLSAGEEQA